MAEGSLHSTQMNVQTCEKQVFQVGVKPRWGKMLAVQSSVPNAHTKLARMASTRWKSRIPGACWAVSQAKSWRPWNREKTLSQKLGGVFKKDT